MDLSNKEETKEMFIQHYPQYKDSIHKRKFYENNNHIEGILLSFCTKETRCIFGEIAFEKPCLILPVQLERKNTKFRIVDEAEQPDGSIIVHIKKQYNNHSCDEYMK